MPRMEQKQLNARVPDFVRDEFDRLKVELRELGSKPTDGDLVAALVHAAAASAQKTKSLIEDFVKYELEVERSEGKRPAR